MINNQNAESEKLEPKDSKRKKSQDEEAVLKPKDKDYAAEKADFGNIAKKKENSEQAPN